MSLQNLQADQPGFRMSVLSVFGTNLRSLTALRGPQTVVAEQLGIGRIQFQRYLRSESFPKPNVLKRICDYFGVDARILTERLTPQQLIAIRAGHYKASLATPESQAMQQAVAWCCPDQDYFSARHDLPDGIYQRWRGSKSRPDCAYVSLIQIKTFGAARVVRGYDARGYFPSGENITGREREFRGMLLHQQTGYVIVYFHSEPSRFVSMLYLTPLQVNYKRAAVGFSALARDYHPNHSRISRLLMVRLDDDWGSWLKAARRPSFVPWTNVPEAIMTHIRPKDECF